MAIHVYKFFKDDKGVYRPWIPIRIINPSNHKFINSHALLDTGADECVFPKFIADQVGIELKAAGVRTKEMQGVSQEKIQVWFHTFKVELLTPDYKNAVWGSKNFETGCVDHDNILPILGFNNFMCHFKVTFNHATRKIQIDDKPVI